MSSETDGAVAETPLAVLPYRDEPELATPSEFLQRNLRMLEELAGQAEYEFTHDERAVHYEDSKLEAIERRAQAALIRDLLTFV